MLTAHGITDAGPVRKNNEDAFLVDHGLRVFVVADGMGGHKAGEVASALAIDAIQGFLRRSHGGEDFTWPYGIEPTLSFQANRLMTSCRLANRRVVKAGESRDDYAGLGSTVVAVLIDEEGQLAYASVGDSRIYSYRHGRLEQITEDDSWAATVLGRDQAAPKPVEHPMRNVLTNVIGAREPLEMTVKERALEAEETLLLCSDGLHGSVDAATIAAQLGSSEPVESIAATLVRMAIDRGSRDNVTALVVRWRAAGNS